MTSLCFLLWVSYDWQQTQLTVAPYDDKTETVTKSNCGLTFTMMEVVFHSLREWMAGKWLLLWVCRNIINRGKEKEKNTIILWQITKTITEEILKQIARCVLHTKILLKVIRLWSVTECKSVQCVVSSISHYHQPVPSKTILLCLLTHTHTHTLAGYPQILKFVWKWQINRNQYTPVRHQDIYFLKCPVKV